MTDDGKLACWYGGVDGGFLVELEICCIWMAGVLGVSPRYSIISAPACFVLVKLRRAAGGGVRGGEVEITLLEGWPMNGRLASWSSSSEAEGASNIGESCNDGRVPAVSGRSSTGDCWEKLLLDFQPALKSALNVAELEEARTLFLD